MERNTDLLDVIAKFEDANFPLWDYAKETDLTDIGMVKHFLRSIIKELDWTKLCVENALLRIESDGKLQDKFETLLKRRV